MKVALLLANGKYSVIADIVEVLVRVLRELDVQLQIIDLNQLPYFEKSKVFQMDEIVECLEECKGVIAISSVSLIGIHGAMQSFFDHMSLYEKGMQNKPLLTITYSEGIGEVEAAHMISRGWTILGGGIGSIIALNNSVDIEQLIHPLEKNIENFYRLMKQVGIPVIASERKLYLQTRSKEKLVNENRKSSEENFNQLLHRASQKIEIKSDGITEPEKNEITGLIRSQLKMEEEENKISVQTGVYTKPVRQVAKSSSFKQLQNLPHYFVVQHDKTLALIVQYLLTDTQEKAYINIQNGECVYHEGVVENPVIEISLTEDTLRQVMKRILTYQKAFMIGKIKVKGNFVLVAKLDQIFKPL